MIARARPYVFLGIVLGALAACSADESASCRGSSCSDGGAGTAGNGAGAVAGAGGPSFGAIAGQNHDAAGETGCISEDVNFGTLPPNVMLLVDTSASMIIPDISGVPRWDALEQALFGDEGMVPQLQQEMRFGLTLYASAKPPETPPNEQECPFLEEEPLALDSANTLAELFRATTPRGTTPTGESLDRTWRALASLPEDVIGPRIIVLATDGEPTLCGATDQQEAARQLAVTAVTDAFAAGITTFVVAVGSELGEEHLRQLANLGQGFSASDATDRSYRVLDAAALDEAFGAIAVRARSCAFELDGVVHTRDAPHGKVLLDGSPLGYEDPDGWMLAGPSQLGLQGAACEAIRSGAISLEIRFPCGTVVPK